MKTLFRSKFYAFLVAAIVASAGQSHAAVAIATATMDIRLAVNLAEAGWTQSITPPDAPTQSTVTALNSYGNGTAIASPSVSGSADSFFATVSTAATATYPPASMGWASAHVNPHIITFTNGTAGASDLFFGVTTYVYQLATAEFDEQAWTNISYGWNFEDDLLERELFGGGTNIFFSRDRYDDFEDSFGILGAGAVLNVPQGDSVRIYAWLNSQSYAIAAPEPSTWTILMSGFLLAGAAFRFDRRRLRG